MFHSVDAGTGHRHIGTFVPFTYDTIVGYKHNNKLLIIMAALKLVSLAEQHNNFA